MNKKVLFIVIVLAIMIQASFSLASSGCHVEKLDVRYDYTWTSGQDYLLKIKASNPRLTRLQIDNPSRTGIINLLIKQIGWHGVRFRLENIQDIEGDTKFEVFIYKGRDLVHYDSAIIPLTCRLDVNEHKDVYFGNFKITKVVKS